MKKHILTRTQSIWGENNSDVYSVCSARTTHLRYYLFFIILIKALCDYDNFTLMSENIKNSLNQQLSLLLGPYLAITSIRIVQWKFQVEVNEFPSSRLKAEHV